MPWHDGYLTLTSLLKPVLTCLVTLKAREEMTQAAKITSPAQDRDLSPQFCIGKWKNNLAYSWDSQAFGLSSILCKVYQC